MKAMERGYDVYHTLRQTAMERGYDVYHTLRQTLESGWEVLARQPAVPVLAECAGRLLLGVMLSAARVFDTYSPFALGFVAASGSGLGGFAALVGASLGYLSTLGLVSGLRYVSAAIFIYAVAFAFYDMPVYQKRWFMPLCGGRHCQRPPGPRPPRSGKGPAPGVAPLTGPPGPRLSLLPQDQR